MRLVVHGTFSFSRLARLRPAHRPVRRRHDGAKTVRLTVRHSSPKQAGPPDAAFGEACGLLSRASSSATGPRCSPHVNADSEPDTCSERSTLIRGARLSWDVPQPSGPPEVRSILCHPVGRHGVKGRDLVLRLKPDDRPYRDLTGIRPMRLVPGSHAPEWERSARPDLRREKPGPKPKR